MTPVRGDSEHTFPSLRGGECAPLIYHETATSSSRVLTVDASLTTSNGFCMKPSTASASSTEAFSGEVYPLETRTFTSGDLERIVSFACSRATVRKAIRRSISVGMVSHQEVV